MKALVIGGVSLDTIIHIDNLDEIGEDKNLWADNFFESVGGTGAGKALALNSLGVETFLITTLGKDEANKKIKAFLDKNRLKYKALSVDETLTHTNIMHSNGKRLSISTHYSKKKLIFNEHDDEEIIISSDVIFLNINDFCRKYIPLIKKHNKIVVVDIHDYDPPNPYHQDFIDVADYLITSGVNIKNNIEFLKSTIDLGKKVAIITLNTEGLIAMDENYQIYTKEAYKDFVHIDSNGAGDSFTAGFILKLFESNIIDESLEFGNICGGISCTSKDLFNLEYDKDKIEEIIQNKKS